MPGPRIPGQTTKVRSFSAFVRAANPDFDLERRKEPAWEFEGGRVRRVFHQNIYKFGPYLPHLPFDRVAPVVSGDPQVGAELFCTTGEWGGTTPFTFAYQWMRGITPTGGTAASYTLQPIDFNAMIHCLVTADNSVGATQAESNAIGPIYELPPVNIAVPVVSGVPGVGQMLSVTDGEWTENPSSYSYQWVFDPPPAPTNITVPVISGTPQEGATLSVTVGAWTDNPTGYSYQWIREP